MLLFRKCQAFRMYFRHELNAPYEKSSAVRRRLRNNSRYLFVEKTSKQTHTNWRRNLAEIVSADTKLQLYIFIYVYDQRIYVYEE